MRCARSLRAQGNGEEQGRQAGRALGSVQKVWLFSLGGQREEPAPQPKRRRSTAGAVSGAAAAAFSLFPLLGPAGGALPPSVAALEVAEESLGQGAELGARGRGHALDLGHVLPRRQADLGHQLRRRKVQGRAGAGPGPLRLAAKVGVGGDGARALSDGGARRASGQRAARLAGACRHPAPRVVRSGRRPDRQEPHSLSQPNFFPFPRHPPPFFPEQLPSDNQENSSAAPPPTDNDNNDDDNNDDGNSNNDDNDDDNDNNDNDNDNDPGVLLFLRTENFISRACFSCWSSAESLLK